MNLQKLQTQREGHRRFIARYLQKIEEAKENDSMVEFDAIFAAIEGKVEILEALNDKILSQTDADGTEEETFQTDEYSMELEIKLCRLRAFRGQQNSSEPSSTPREDQGNSGTNEQQQNNNGLNPAAPIPNETAKIGYANLTSSHGDTEPERIQLQLTHEVLVLLREEYVPEQPEEEDCERKEMLEKVLEEYVSEQPEEEDCERKEMLEKVRTVEIYRDAGGGLGLSVKGGAEHKIPALISRIVPGQAAAHTEQLFVGDAILKVNDQNVECYTHDQLIEALKNAGDVVTLVVKYFKPAAIFLNKSLQSASENDNENVSSSQCGVMPHLKKQWVVFSSIPLIYAYLTRYFNGTDKLRTNAFEVMGIDGNSSGILQFEDSLSLAEWIAAITNNITQLLNQMVRMMNRLLLPEEQIMYMGWGQERASPGRNWQAWKPKFIALKGTDIYLFDIPPMQERDWLSCNTVFHVYECMFKVLKDSELVDDKQHCCSIQTGSKETIYVSVESRSDLLQLERSWYRTNHQAVIRLKSRTFGCTYKGRLSGLSLDIDVGFSLYDSETKSYLWCYKFSRLKGSSDDGKLKLKLHFHAETQGQVETREIECSSLQTLLYCIHAFLSAKLASVDPEFLKNY